VIELPGTAWLAIPDFQYELFSELTLDPARLPPKASVWGDIVYREGSAPQTFWHRAVLNKPMLAEFSSVAEAANILRSIQRNWAYVPGANFRRAELIKAKLPYVNEKPRDFPYSVPRSPMGAWTLIDANTLFASAETSSPFPAGQIRFVEDHENPPSRAYLKMYEALAWVDWLWGRSPSDAELPTGRYAENLLPGVGSRVLDAGACPGGWTWVFDRLGATVTAIDRAELAPALMAKPNITFMKHDAFTLKPEDLGPQDWVCSDVICYPERLYEWVMKWIESGLCRNFICTIKMQGEANREMTKRFADLPGGHVVHLTANKHELTWLCRLP